MRELFLMTVDYQPDESGSRYFLDPELFNELDGSLMRHLEEIITERGWQTGKVFAPWDKDNKKPLLTVTPAALIIQSI